MRTVIEQTIELPSDRLLEMYLDPAIHTAITGFPVTIGREPGSEFKAFEGKLFGTMLAVSDGLVVQSWRSISFRPEDPDSTLILSFADGKIRLVHLDVPEHDVAGVTGGWEKFYWTPWRKYLELHR